MSLKKLSEADKNAIVTLYRDSEATTSTLAEQFEVSSSTISRFLKASFTLAEYEELIQKKRLARTPYRRSSVEMEEDNRAKNLTELSPTLIDELREAPETTILDELNPVSSYPQQMEKPVNSAEILNQNLIQQLDLFALSADEEDEAAEQVEVLTLQQLLGEDIGDLDEDEDQEYEEDEEDFSFEERDISSFPQSVHVNLEILPLSQAKFPKVCYLVIDRRSELITRPLKDFRELGKIPLTEIQEQTLPIFDNHRIARRFSNRRERVIKVPDSSIFTKTCSYLQAKGITRILLDGQVYALC